MLSLVSVKNSIERITVDQPERPLPARLRRKMLYQVEQMLDRHEWLGQCLRGRVVRPVNNQRFPDNIVARDKTPVAAVERGIAIVAHREIIAGGHHHLALPHMVDSI